MAKKVLSNKEVELRPFSLDKEDAIEREEESADEMEIRIQQAFEEGFKKGEEKAQKRIEAEIESLRSIVKSISEYRDELLRNTEVELIDLSFKIAEKIVRISLEKDRSIVQKIIRSAVQEVKDKSEITIYISPEDEPIVMGNKDKILEGIEGEVKFILEPGIEKGGCIVQTSSGRIDALIVSQLEELRKRLGAS